VAGREAARWVRLSNWLAVQTKTSDATPVPPQRRISDPAAAKFRRRIVWHDDHDVVVTVWAGVSAGDGHEKVDALRMVRRNESAHNLTKAASEARLARGTVD